MPDLTLLKRRDEDALRSPRHRNLLAEVEELAEGLNFDHWNVEQKRKPDDRIVFLEVVRDKMVRAEVVTKYALSTP